MPIQLICLDADDTLWHNMRHFEVAEHAFFDMLAPFADAGIAREVVFGVNPPPNFFAYSLDPTNPERIVRERADGHKEVGRMSNGRFRKIRDLG